MFPSRIVRCSTQLRASECRLNRTPLFLWIVSLCQKYAHSHDLFLVATSPADQQRTAVNSPASVQDTYEAMTPTPTTMNQQQQQQQQAMAAANLNGMRDRQKRILLDLNRSFSCSSRAGSLCRNPVLVFDPLLWIEPTCRWNVSCFIEFSGHRWLLWSECFGPVLPWLIDQRQSNTRKWSMPTHDRPRSTALLYWRRSLCRMPIGYSDICSKPQL